jgi:Protein of unknown function (DUF3455)
MSNYASASSVVLRTGVVVLLAGCATTVPIVSPPIPQALQVPSNQALMLQTRATGVQIYDCKPARSDPSRYEWTFRAPEADLFDDAGRKIGKHYAGPSWEAIDGSTVVGEVKARDDGPDPNAIPWLLLTAKSKSGIGVMAKTASVQRLQTSGGSAPAEACTQAQAGKEARVPYKALYYFYEIKS